jgi:MazG family protein
VAPLQTSGEKFERLVGIMARLRAPGGCPWDREQTFDTIQPYLLEETYEVLDAIDRRDWPGLADELGDLLLQAVFFAQMAAEEGRFDIGDSLDAISEKLVRRHPHIFADSTAETAQDVKQRWEEIKAAERRAKGETRTSALDGAPRNLPALAECQTIASKAAEAGFEWPSVEQAIAKVEEEVAELKQASASGSAEAVGHELGDALATLVNLGRMLNVDAEQSLRKANARFRRRFRYVEERTALAGASLEEIKALWREAKAVHD